MNEVAPSRRDWLADVWRIGFILALTLATRFWLVQHTEVLSRDSIMFIRFALQLEQPPEDHLDPSHHITRLDVVRSTYQPPGYPLAILAISQPIRAVMGTSSDSLALSAQLTSILASLLLIFPMYFLGRMIFDRQAAFIGTLLFQVLPVCVQVTSDGLSDSLFLLASATSLWLSAVAFRRTSPLWFLPAGITIGMAYLVRPEGLILAVAAGLIMLVSRLRGQCTWGSSFKRLAVLTFGVLLVMSPYVAIIGKLTNKPTGDGFLRWLKGDELKPSWIKISDQRPTHEGADVPLAAWFNEFGQGQRPGAAWASKAMMTEFLKTSTYVIPFFAAIGLMAFWPRLNRDPAFLMMLGVGAGHTALLWFVAYGAGYVAERHLLLVTLVSCYLAAAALPKIGEKIAAWKPAGRLGSPAFWSAALAFAFVAVAVPYGLKPLHANRVSNHAAGRWLAERLQPGDYVIDPFAWSEYYAGCIREGSYALPAVPRAYGILTPGDNHPRLHQMPIAKLVAEHGEVVYHWPEDKPRDQAKLLIYRWEGYNFNEYILAWTERAAKK